MKRITSGRPGRTAAFIFFMLIRLSTHAQLWSLPQPGAKWDSINVRWVAANPNMNWTITPRTGLRDEYFPYFPNTEYGTKPGWATWTSTVDSVVRVKTNKYYISDYVQGYLEYLPNGYNDPKNANKKYPLIIYFPGCGEMGGGTLFTHLVGGVKRPNFFVGMGRLASSTSGSLDHFNGLPRELLWNGDYFSQIPLKTPGQAAPQGGWPTQEVIVMACVISGRNDICGSYALPSIFDVGKAIDVAVNVNKANYRVDASRIYVTGMSAGAGIPSWNSPGELPDLATKLAAIIPVAAVDNIYANEPTMPTSQRARNIINGGTNVLVVTNLTDIIRDANGNITNNIIQNNQRSAEQLMNVPGVRPGQVATSFFTYPNQPAGRVHDAWGWAYRSRNSPEAYLDRGVFKIRTRTNYYPYTDPVTGEGYTSYEWMVTKQNLLVLPVDIIQFTATRVDEGVRLDWVSASELNGEKYILERSTGGTEFTTIHEQGIQGNSNVERKYSYIDRNIPQSQYLYYRLSEKDKDGKLRYIGIKKIYIGKAGFEIKLYPTVVSTKTTVEVQGIVNDKLNVSVVDASGRLLMQRVIPPRQARTEFDMSGLSRGVYIMKISGASSQSAVKFIKQ